MVRPVDRFSPLMAHAMQTYTRMCLLGGSFMLLSIYGVKSLKTPNFGGREWVFSSYSHQILKLAYFPNYDIDHNQILHNDRIHLVHFVDGSN